MKKLIIILIGLFIGTFAFAQWSPTLLYTDEVNLFPVDSSWGLGDSTYPINAIVADSFSDGTLTITGGQITSLIGLFEVDSGGDDYFAITNLTEGDILLVDSVGNIGIGTSSPDSELDIKGTSSPTLTIQSTDDSSDPTITFKSSDTAHEIDLSLDESAAHDHLVLEGKTASEDTGLVIEALDGQAAELKLYSGATNNSKISVGAADHLTIRQGVDDANMVFQLEDGATDLTITWDSDVDKLKHSAGLFDFDDDDLTTTGTLTADSASFSSFMVDDNIVNLSDTTDEYVLAFDTPTQTWRGVASTGSGDMLQSVYDTDADGDIDVAAGGTEKSSWTQYAIPYLSNTTVFGEITIGAANELLAVDSAGTGYTFVAAGAGDVLSVGDCTDGACFDGSSDGGTYLEFYNIDSNKTQLIAFDTAGDIVVTMPGITGALALTSDITSDIVTHAADDNAHHELVSLTGQNYLTISTQTITVGEIEPDDLAGSDFGDFTCDGDVCSLDTSYLPLAGGTVTGLLEVASAGDDYFAITNLTEGDILLVDSTGDLTFAGSITATGFTGALTGAATDLNCSDCINATEIEDIYLLTAGDTMAGILTVDTLTDGTLTMDNGIITGASSITSTSFVGALTGNASTATALETARTIAGVSFDGTANIDIPSTGLSDTADLLYEAELDDFSELQAQIADKTLVNEEDTIGSLTVDSISDGTLTITGGDISAGGTATFSSFVGDLTGNVTGSLVGNASSATALTANGSNCSAGSYALGVDVYGAAESCTDATTEINSVVNGLGGTGLTCSSQSCNVDLGTAIVTGEITDGTILEADLDADESPADNDILTFDTTGANFSWQTPTELGLLLLTGGTITGTLDVATLSINSAITFPIVDGTDGQVLTTDGSGNIAWETAAGSGLFTDSGSFAYLTDITDDLVIGATLTTAPLFFDVSEETLSIGLASAGDSAIDFYESANRVWTIGLDDSDSDAFKISGSSDFSSSVLKIATPGGAITFNDAYTFPTSDGNNTEVLVTNGSGTLTWSAAGSGDVLSVGDCADGACFDGSSDGGTYLEFYNIDSNKTQLIAADSAADLVITMPDQTGTLALTSVSSLSSLTTVGTLVGGGTSTGFTVDLDNSTLTCTNCIDISDNTNLVAGTNITLSDDTLNVDDKFLKNDATDEGVGITLTGDNSAANTAYVPMVLYDSDATAPAASGFPIGTLYIQYTP